MSSEAQRRLILHMSISLGPRFAHSLIRHRLVDEYRLTVHPITLGGGSALMHGLPEPQRFELVSSTVYTDGSTVQVLRPAGHTG